MPVLRVGRLTIPTPQANADAFLAHNSCDPLSPDTRTVVLKLSVNSWASVRFMALLVDYTNLGRELRILLFVLRRFTITPRIISGPRRSEKQTHHRNAELARMFVDALVSQRDVFAKKTVAFLINTRSRHVLKAENEVRCAAVQAAACFYPHGARPGARAVFQEIALFRYLPEVAS
jgi:hypothetical protein